MKYNNIYKLAALFTLMVIAGCNKYLDVTPKGKQLLKSTSDYNLWLNSAFLDFENDAQNLDYLADDIDNPTLTASSTAVNDLIYTWATQFLANITIEPPIWGDHYTSIYYYNTVLVGIDTAAGSTQQGAQLKAEALLGRAFEYLYLINLYAKEYDSATAAQDLAVPFVTAIDISTTTPPRSTVQALYNQIITDLNAAIPNLPVSNGTDRYRGSVAAAYSVLARAYLYMRNYTAAETSAQNALKADNTLSLLNYTTFTNVGSLPNQVTSTESIYARQSENPVYYPTQSFLKTFDTTDARLSLFYYSYDNNYNTVKPDYSFSQRGVVMFVNGNYQPNVGTTVAEMELIIAEGAARSGDLTTALTALNTVRTNRFPNYIAYTSNNKDTVLQKVLSERTFEFPFSAIRWFDMRRLNKEGRIPGINRYDNTGNIIATLAPSSPRYVLQIPLAVLKFNPGMQQNP